MPSPDSFITDVVSGEDVRRWTKARERIADRIDKLTSEIDRLRAQDGALVRIIKAAGILLVQEDGGDFQDTEPSPRQVQPAEPAPASPVLATPPYDIDSDIPLPTTWVGGIKSIVEGSSRGLSYDELRQIMQAGPAAGRPWSEKSFHGAIGKLADNAEIVRYKCHVFSRVAFDRFREDVAAGAVNDLPEPSRPQHSPLGAEIRRYLATCPSGATSGEMISEARQVPELAAAIDKNKSYAYNVIKRLADKGEIVKTGGRYFLASPEKTEAPSGGAAGASEAVEG